MVGQPCQVPSLQIDLILCQYVINKFLRGTCADTRFEEVESIHLDRISFLSPEDHFGQRTGE